MNEYKIIIHQISCVLVHVSGISLWAALQR